MMLQAKKPGYKKLKKPITDQRIEWGIHASEGITWGQVDEEYIRKIIQLKKEGLQETMLEIEALEEELTRRELVAEAELPMALQCLRYGYLPLVQKFHPDRGGDAQKMRELNAAYEAVKELIAQQQKTSS
jgi:hypothetical protein